MTGAGLATRQTPTARLWRTYVTDVRVRANAEASEFSHTMPPRRAARRVGLVLAATATSLIAIQLLKHGSDPGWAISTLDAVGLDGTADRLETALLESRYAGFNQLVFWAVVQISGYVVLPLILIKAVFAQRLRDNGVRKPAGGGAIYTLAFLALAPLLIAVSFTEPFQETYPFYDLSAGEGLWPRMVIWWVLYAGQFLALEFFFRGFVLHSLKPVLGYMAIFVMIVPYVMIHFQKPLLELLAAAPAGFFLGTLALKTRTIWWGAALHVAVALAIDLASLTQKGLAF